MSAANVELVKRSYEVINAIGRTGSEFVDPEELAPDLWTQVAPDFELHERSDLPDAKSYRGRDETKQFWRKTQELFAEIQWEPREFTDLGHAVVVAVRVSALGRGSEVPIEADEANVFWFRDGALARLQAFPTKREALAAAERGSSDLDDDR
jgi:ketosteroid isomerase-like protein